MKFILGKKIDMTQKFLADGTIIPVTRIAAGPCFVSKKIEHNGPEVNSIQITLAEKPFSKLTNPLKGFFNKVFRREVGYGYLREFRLAKADPMFAKLNVGEEITVDAFKLGDVVKAEGVRKGRGFQGVVKRFHFRGHPGHHGHKDQLRMPGSSGATGPGHVFPGTRKPGLMGEEGVTVKNLEVVEIIPEKNEIWLRGAVPGYRGSLLKLEAPGDFEVKKPMEPIVEAVPAVASTPATETSIEKPKVE